MDNSTIIKIAGVFLLLILLVPYTTEYAPKWKIQVVNGKGNALANIEVEEKYYYVNFLTPSIETKRTDKNGYVIFPARNFTCPLICRIPVAFLNVLFSLGHGPKIWGGATVREKDTYDFIRYVNGTTKKNELRKTLKNQN